MAWFEGTTQLRENQPVKTSVAICPIRRHVGWRGQSEKHSEALKKAWLNRKTRWTEEEILLLRTIFPKTENENIVKILKRAKTAIRQKASELKLRKDKDCLRTTRQQKNTGQYTKGNKPWIYGKTKENNYQVKRFFSEERKGKNNPAYSYLINAWKDPHYRDRTIRKVLEALSKRPTRPERKLIDIIQHHNLNFKYVGNGKVIIGGLCPDFIHSDRKLLIEVFGRIYHDPVVTYKDDIPWKSQYWGRLAHFSQFGYDCIILWDDELDRFSESEIVEKITSFVGD